MSLTNVLEMSSKKAKNNNYLNSLKIGRQNSQKKIPTRTPTGNVSKKIIRNTSTPPAMPIGNASGITCGG